MTNLILIISMIIGVIGFIVLRIYLSVTYKAVYRAEKFKSLGNIVDYVRQEILNLKKVGVEEVLLPEYEKIERHKFRLKLEDDLTQCTYGVKSSVIAVRAIIKSILKKGLKEQDVNMNVPLDPSFMTPYQQWVTLCYILLKRGYKVIDYLGVNYEWFAPRKDKDLQVFVTNEDLDKCYRAEIKPEELDLEDKFNILTRYVYAEYKGFGLVDYLKELDAEGWEIGTSGSCTYQIEGNYSETFKNTGAFWTMAFGQWSHLRFLQAPDEKAIKKIIQQISATQGYTGLTETQSLKVSVDPNGSRISACRPPVSESWGVFVRNFTKGMYDLDILLNKVDKDGNEILHNWQLARDTIKWIMRSSVTTGFTGEQSSGKTSTMKGSVRYLPNGNIRVLELAAELGLRDIYKERNIMSMVPTATISNNDIQDFFKKTDAKYMIVGEVAQKEVTMNMIQASNLYSATIFSHHGATVPDMINALADDLINMGAAKEKSKAVRDILDCVKLNVHMRYITVPGHGRQRVVGRISQIIPLDDKELVDPDYTKDTAYQLAAIKESFDESIRRQTQGRFTWRDILIFDEKDATYKVTDYCYTNDLIERMLMNIELPHEKKEFATFLRENWHI